MRLLNDIEHDKVDIVLFCKLDRWFRSVQAYYQIQPILDAHNTAWQAIQEDYETIKKDIERDVKQVNLD